MGDAAARRAISAQGYRVGLSVTVTTAWWAGSGGTGDLLLTNGARLVGEGLTLENRLVHYSTQIKDRIVPETETARASPRSRRNDSR
ncbi:MAG: hypothetical protein CMJ18_20960 [Phycisphaeraceae bacterium]|nr:hypothetical protein [Phycisphaeraceae bacterium]